MTLTEQSVLELQKSMILIEKQAYEKGYNYAIEAWQDVYKALGFQGGTIHQVIEEVKRLKKVEEKAIKVIKAIENL